MSLTKTVRGEGRSPGGALTSRRFFLSTDGVLPPGRRGKTSVPSRLDTSKTSAEEKKIRNASEFTD